MPVVAVTRAFVLGGHRLEPGARLIARRAGDDWYVTFNGLEVRADRGTVGELESKHVIEMYERRTARDEEYQVAPTKSS